MFVHITWGYKRKTKGLGYVADFCPICRDIRQFRLIRIGMAFHINYISLGPGQLAGYEAVCQGCRLVLPGDRAKYSDISSSRLDDVVELAHRTFPNLHEHYSARLTIEETLRRNPSAIGADLRAELIREPFALLAPQVQAKRATEMEFDRKSGRGCLSTILGALLLLVLGAVSNNRWRRDLLLLCSAGFFALGTVYTLLLLLTSTRRWIRSEVLPGLARCLRILDPSEAELGACLAHFRQRRLKIGTKIRARQLYEEIHQRDDVELFEDA